MPAKSGSDAEPSASILRISVRRKNIQRNSFLHTGTIRKTKLNSSLNMGSSKKVLKWIHGWTPLWFSSAYMPFVYLIRHLKDLRLHEYVIEGCLKEGDGTLRLGFFGNDERIMCYWLNTLYGEATRVEKKPRVAVWNIPSRLRNNPHGHEIGLVEVSGISRQFPVAGKGFVLPRWLETKLKVDESLDALSNKQNLRNIRKHQFTCRYSTSMEDLQFFYERMFRPYISDRHKDASVIADFSFFKKRMKKKGSGLFVLMENQEPVAACFNERINGRMKFSGIGILDGRRDIIQKGAMRAIYYFMLRHYKEAGEEWIDYGGTSPLLSDGLTKFKRSMKAVPKSRHPYGEKSLVLIPVRMSGAVSEFLGSNPFLFLDRGRFYRALFPDPSTASNKENFLKWLQHLQFPGVSGNRIYCRSHAEMFHSWISEESLSGYEIHHLPVA